ncbi:hypothetical protein BCR33DRAFT_700262 [Rhizoclosmatium globosum]|uniref:TMEM14-domain-containing protein n=1 Tax=Rhizoclosmatium globosum TaxID=329046 RepID=A0A1Y2BVU3_9FUNG|nr:hypothetical protein BCR33DRAFT_700262 [Rhizoclosmatium globosum]|eukprot:ORY38747.1 hypothetical protein BCR33DRAFT_700262 [Rhizoclosmatium globosum]
MVANHIPAYVLGGLCAVGGTMGYVKGKSVPSLVAGMTCAGLYALAGTRLAAKASFGAEIAIAVSVLLLVMMGPKAVSKRAPVAIVMSSLGLVGTVFYVSVLLAANKIKKN